MFLSKFQLYIHLYGVEAGLPDLEEPVQPEPAGDAHVVDGAGDVPASRSQQKNDKF